MPRKVTAMAETVKRCIGCGRVISSEEMICLSCGSENEMQTFRPHIITNGDMIRQMDDEQLIRYMIPFVCAMHHVRDCQNNCDDCAREWLKREAEP